MRKIRYGRRNYELATEEFLMLDRYNDVMIASGDNVEQLLDKRGWSFVSEEEKEKWLDFKSLKEIGNGEVLKQKKIQNLIDDLKILMDEHDDIADKITMNVIEMKDKPHMRRSLRKINEKFEIKRQEIIVNMKYVKNKLVKKGLTIYDLEKEVPGIRYFSKVKL